MTAVSASAAIAATLGIGFAGIILAAAALSGWWLLDKVRSRRKGSPQMRNRPAAAALLAVYAGSVVLANWLTTRYGLIGIGFGLMAPAGTAAIGGAIMTRDLLQDAGGRVLVLLAIVAGAALSFAVSAHQIAIASGVTFLIAESLEFAVYTPLRRRAGWGTPKWSAVVGVANFTGALADTLIFLSLARFPVTVLTVGGQMLGKAYVTVAVVALGLAIRRSREAVTASAA